MGWDAGNASKLKSSKSSASGIGRFALADGGRAKASVHHNSQSNNEAGGGKGSETACFLGAQSKPRGFLTADSSELHSEKRLFRECAEGGEESFWVDSDDRKSEQEASFGEGSLRNTRHVLVVCYEASNATHKRRLRGGGKTG